MRPPYATVGGALSRPFGSTLCERIEEYPERSDRKPRPELTRSTDPRRGNTESVGTTAQSNSKDDIRVLVSQGKTMLLNQSARALSFHRPGVGDVQRLPGIRILCNPLPGLCTNGTSGHTRLSDRTNSS